MRISDWSSDVCSSDLANHVGLDHPLAALEHRMPVNRRQDRFLEEPGKSRRPRPVDQPGGEARQRLAAVPELRQHDLPLLNGERSSEEQTSDLQSLMRTSYAAFCWKNKTISTPQR